MCVISHMHISWNHVSFVMFAQAQTIHTTSDLLHRRLCVMLSWKQAFRMQTSLCSVSQASALVAPGFSMHTHNAIHKSTRLSSWVSFITSCFESVHGSDWAGNPQTAAWPLCGDDMISPNQTGTIRPTNSKITDYGNFWQHLFFI